MPLLLGCIADDFTGATDLANTLVKGGMTAVQVIGVPTGPLPEADAIIIALKSRTAPVGEAVAQSLAACDALLAAGAKQIFWKYCSTFDSTDQGNIGPVADALLKRLGSGFALACPAFPTNGRTIYLGHLFVGNALLNESGMENHPLTPMTDANLVRVLGRQTDGAVGLVPFNTVGPWACPRISVALACCRRAAMRPACRPCRAWRRWWRGLVHARHSGKSASRGIMCRCWNWMRSPRRMRRH